MTTVSTQEDRDPIMVELGENLTRLQVASGLSLKQLERAVVRLLQDDASSPTHETIRQYHAGAGKASRANLALIAALCVVYKTPIAEVSPEFGRRAEQLKLVLRAAIEPSEHTLWYVQSLCSQLRFEFGDMGVTGWGEQAWTPTVNSSTGTPATNEPGVSAPTRSAATATRTGRSSEPSTKAA